jgi:hypothetical protein
MSQPSFSMALMVCGALFLSSQQASPAECRSRNIVDTKPRLNGRVEDQTRGVGVAWHSAAGKRGADSLWVIDNAICNVGQVPLIVDWQKAQLSNDAYSPLGPGLEIFNTFTMGPDEPAAGSAPLKYGSYSGGQTQTRIYGGPDNNKMGAVMDSVLGGSFYKNNDVMASNNPIAPTSFVLSIQVLNKGDGYVFIANINSEPKTELQLALSSSQNEAFESALKRAGVNKFGVAPLRKIGRSSQNETFERLGDTQFVYMSVASTIQLFIPTKGSSEIENATVVVLRDDAVPALVGKVSLFR